MIMKLFKSCRLIAVNNILFKTDFKVERVHTESLNSWKSLEICPATFLSLLPGVSYTSSNLKKVAVC